MIPHNEVSGALVINQQDILSFIQNKSQRGLRGRVPHNEDSVGVSGRLDRTLMVLLLSARSLSPTKRILLSLHRRPRCRPGRLRDATVL